MNEKIENEVLQLLIEIFDKRYKLFPNNICQLSAKALKMKDNIESICSHFYELSIYILNILYSQFKPFFAHVIKEINFKKVKKDEYENIKVIFEHIGNDIKNIFKGALDNIENIKISNILINYLDDYYFKELKKKNKKVRNVAPYKEKEKFENILEKIKTLLFEKNYEKVLNIKICFCDENEKNEEKNEKDEKKDEANIEKTNEKKMENESKEKEEHLGKYSNIEDLVNYINGPQNKKTKKKKKKKKKNNKKEENKEYNGRNTYIEDDDYDYEYLNYKNSLEEFTKKLVI